MRRPAQNPVETSRAVLVCYLSVRQLIEIANTVALIELVLLQIGFSKVFSYNTVLTTTHNTYLLTVTPSNPQLFFTDGLY